MPLRIGLVGCGNWGRLILRDLLACGAEVHVVGRGPASLEQALTLGAATARSDDSRLHQMDGLVVATPSETHAGVLDRLLPIGLPIFVEKPMTVDLPSARRLAAAAEGRLFVMDKWRYHAGIEAMRREIASGRTGEVMGIRTTRWGWGFRREGCSPLWHLAPHDLSIALHLIGCIPPLRSAFPVTAAPPYTGAVAHFTAETGPSVTIDFGVASPENRRRCLVIGSRATLELRDSYDDRIFVRDGPPASNTAEERTIDTGSEMPLLKELQCFLDFLKGGPPPMSSAREGLLIVERLAAVEAALAW